MVCKEQQQNNAALTGSLAMKHGYNGEAMIYTTVDAVQINWSWHDTVIKDHTIRTTAESVAQVTTHVRLY